jgi:hypothetical protein
LNGSAKPGANLGVLIIAGGEPFTEGPSEIAKAFYTNNKLDAIVLMSNGQISSASFPTSREFSKSVESNVTVALGIDGLKDDHESIRQKPGSWDIASTPRASCRRSRRNTRGWISRRAPAS